MQMIELWRLHPLAHRLLVQG